MDAYASASRQQNRKLFVGTLVEEFAMRKIHLNFLSNTKSHLGHICTWLLFLIIIALPVKAQEGVTREAPRISERSSSQPIDQFPAEQRRILPGPCT